MYRNQSWALWVAPVEHGWHGDTTEINVTPLAMRNKESFVSNPGIL